LLKKNLKIGQKKNIILLELDFPKRTPISENLRKQNTELAQIFGVRGYPTGWFVTPTQENGKVNFNKLGSQGYVANGPATWIAGANRILNSNK
jgi:protein disulfide-isomerase